MSTPSLETQDRRPDGSAPGGKKGEAGVALILTLGFLALLLILAMSFAFTSRTERMAAGVNADMVKARLLCESGVSRALGTLKTSCETGTHVYPATEYFFHVSDASRQEWNDRCVLPSYGSGDVYGVESGLSMNFGTTCQFTPTIAIYTPGCAVSWIDITNTVSTGTQLVGRIAYVVIDDSGKIDPSAVVSSAANETIGSESRLGIQPTEIQLSGIPGLGTALIDNLRPTNATPAGRMPVSGTTTLRWFSWQHLFRSADPGADAGLCAASLFPGSRDIEAWNIDDQKYERFNLSSTVWDSLTGAAGITALKGAATAYTGTGSATSLPWLATLVDQNDNDVSSQICANLIDFSDTDSFATSDYNGTTATYVGLEKVPYINEVQLGVSLTYTSTDYCTFTVKGVVEEVNMYDTAGASAVAVSGTGSLGGAVSFSGTAAAFTTPANSYNLSSTITLLTATRAYAASYANCSLSGIRVVSGDAAPISSSNLHDFAVLPNPAASNIPATIVTPSTIGATTSIWISCQTNDPRCNTTTGRWTWAANNAATAAGIGTPNAKNAGLTLQITGTSTDGLLIDKENITDPALGISTAYIRNGPPQTLWELGAIHRGEPWRTLNLTRYNPALTSATNKYGSGDAAILDQVKLTADGVTRGKFNANSPQAKAWIAVLQGVTVGAAYATPAGGSPVTQAQATNIVTKTSDIATSTCVFAANRAFSSLGGSAKVNRGGIVDATKLVDGTEVGQTTDRAQEELIGKTANLLTVRQNYYTVIVTGQVVKDLGNNPYILVAAGKTVPRNWVKYAGNPTVNTATDKWCSVEAEQKVMATIYRDAFTKTFTLERYEILDE